MTFIRERERQIPRDVTHSWNPKCDTNELTRKTEIDSQTQETNTPKGKEGREKRGDWDGHGRLL